MNLPLRLAQGIVPKRLHWFMGLKTSQAHGKANWMSGKEASRFLAGGNQGVVLAPGRRLSAAESFKNLVLLAPTGSGKTTRYVIPNLLRLSGSAVVTDPSGEIYRATSGGRFQGRRGKKEKRFRRL
jgi:type IV secretory pathway TraG/TraD family ATPase VirD4